MNRRGFLKMLVGGVAVAAAAPSFPFRVFSFPSEIKIAQPEIVQAVIGEYSDYFSSYSPDLADVFLATDFVQMAERRALPANINKC